MSNRARKREAGFSLLELVVATGLGTIVLAAAVSMYTQGVNATWTVSQRAEMQQDFRAASNMLTKDLSLAGAGLGQGAAIQLPTSSTIPVYGCDQTRTCFINGTSVKYPQQGATPYLYGLLTGYTQGPTLYSAQGATDVVTVVYTDPSFYLNCYTAAIASSTTVTFTLPTATSSNCTANGATVQNVNDAAQGLTAGDLVLFTFPATPVVAEVTGAPTQGVNGSGQTTFTVPFASGDILNMNQVSTVPKSLANQANGTTGYATRLLVVTYYIDNSSSPSRLMRQISGHTPMPVAESIVYMKFSYDLFNTSTNTAAVGCVNPGGSGDVCVSGNSSGLLPNQVTKINILNMAMNSSLQGSLYGPNKGYQSIDLETSVSARNLTYVNSYKNQ
jgi:Tfp pilus assembly protein PilW